MLRYWNCFPSKQKKFEHMQPLNECSRVISKLNFSLDVDNATRRPALVWFISLTPNMGKNAYVEEAAKTQILQI